MKNLFLLLISALLATASLTGATITVTSNANSGAGTLRQAIADAGDGDDIVFNLSAGNETIIIQSQLEISEKSISIDGSNNLGSGTRVTVRVPEPGVSQWRAFFISAPDKEVTISNMTIKGGDVSEIEGDDELYYRSGGGISIFIGSRLTLNSVTISESKAARGGGVMCLGAVVFINNLNIIENEANLGGGLVIYYSSCMITGTNISRNIAIASGGGMHVVYGHNLILNSTISDNVSGNDNEDEDVISCGGIHHDAHSGTVIFNSTISGNRIEGSGDTGVGGIGVFSFPSRLLLFNSIVINNMGVTADDIFQDYEDESNKIYCYNTWYDPVKGEFINITTEATSPNVTNTFTAGDLEGLGNNGGGTETMAVSTSSPAYRSGHWLYYNDDIGYYIQGTDEQYYLIAEVEMEGIYFYVNPGYSLISPSPTNPDADKITTDQRRVLRTPIPNIGAFHQNDLTWTGSQNTQWHNASNWNKELETTDGWDIIIANVANKPIVASGDKASCRNLTINSGASLTVNSGGSLITYGSIENEGTIEVKQEITQQIWHLAGVPNNNTLAGIFMGDYLQRWDEPTAQWVGISGITDPLNPLQGYILWGTSESPKTYTFAGTPNTGNQSIAVTYTNNGSGNKGANLLSNPYPSAIDWSGLSATWGAVYYWNGTAYVSWNNGVGEGSQVVPAMQGFFIVVDEPGTFSLTNQNRTHSAQAYYKSEPKAASLVLETVSPGYSDKLFLRFSNQASADFDKTSDAYKLLSFTEGLSQLYSFAGESILSIDVRPETQTIQLGFANDQAGICNIGIHHLADFDKVTLEDTKTNIFHDLTKGAYEFTWNPELDDEMRFKLHLNSVGIDETPISESDILIYAANGQIFIHGAENGEVIVSDLMGRIILQQEISGEEIIAIPANLQTGVHLVTVQNGKEVKTEKVFVK